ncbi:hypothetical protein ANN_18436 [Periplaneta americana]|uniref:Uncharacterized protein n=1 Tax=Periplaneta americana TaxID=6978 RepID=A0ABQ8SQ82_PERAM|nr:hypothetical protein ANN_18436 [Periplaneta americana]
MYDIRRCGYKTARILPKQGVQDSIPGTLTLREEQRLRVFENKVLRKIFGAKRDEVTGEWRKLHNAELHALYTSPDIIRNIKSRRLRWAGHDARMGESRNAYRVLGGRPEGKRPLRRPRRRWEDNIKMDLREVGYDENEKNEEWSGKKEEIKNKNKVDEGEKRRNGMVFEEEEELQKKKKKKKKKRRRRWWWWLWWCSHRLEPCDLRKHDCPAGRYCCEWVSEASLLSCQHDDCEVLTARQVFDTDKWLLRPRLRRYNTGQGAAEFVVVSKIRKCQYGVSALCVNNEAQNAYPDSRFEEAETRCKSIWEQSVAFLVKTDGFVSRLLRGRGGSLEREVGRLGFTRLYFS